MDSVIDPEKHQDLVDLQRAVARAFAELDEYSSALPRETTDEEHRRLEELREQVRQAVTEKETALYGSGLVDEHGYYQAAQALKDAAKTG